ncbi:MAG: response regulator [Synergistaceae bacterium]|jgi:putative two-component system response regulator|nr:response regulator [Synergistaceae bacterium]
MKTMGNVKKRDKVLVVDDVDMNRMILDAILCDDYDVIQAEDGFQAIDILYNSVDLPGIVLLDIMMPDMDGFEVLDLIKSNTRTADIPVVFITAADIESTEMRGLRSGAVDYVSKPFNPDVVKARVDNHLELKRYRDKLEETVDEKVRQMVRSKENMLETLATVIEYRNLESGHHVRRTSVLSRKLVMRMLDIPRYARKLNEMHIENMLKAVPIHDIGKIGVPDHILLKPGRLTPEEFEVIKTHTTIGSNIIDTLLLTDKNDEYLLHCRDIARHHHERYDGKGYPDGLSGSDIPLSARILSIVDVYDALANSRIYKPALPHDDTVRIIKEGAGTQFDPGIVSAFLEISDSFKSVTLGSDGTE